MRKIKSGFTLIELLVVISIIGMLTALIVANYNTARGRARDAQRKSDLNQTKRALRLYYNDQNPTVYPDTVSFGSPWQSGTMVYMKTVPNDPTPGSNYSYRVAAGLQDFCLWATLENTSDGDIARTKTRCTTACSDAGVGFGADDYVYVVCAD